MVVIVDGYNAIRLIENISSSGTISDSQRARFIRRLNEYLSKKNRTIKRLIVVFDGGELRHAESYDRGAFSEVYSGFVDSADDWIVRHVERSGFGEYVVVTNDRGLSKRVSPYVRLVLKVADFLTLLTAAVEKSVNKSCSRKTMLIEYSKDDDVVENVDQEALRQLMDRSTRSMLIKNADNLSERESRVSGSEQDSKKIIRVRRIVKKL